MDIKHLLTVAIVSLVVLSGVQFFLVYNTYELKEEHFFVREKDDINNDYEASIRNDKVMPGGQRILDGYINKDMHTMESLYHMDTAAFRTYRQRVCDSAFTALIRANNLDSVLAVIKQRRHIKTSLDYALYVRDVAVSFHKDQYVSLYSYKVHDNGLGDLVQNDHGVLIGGRLTHIHPQSNVASVSVFASRDYTYRISFDLFVDPAARELTIFQKMLPTLVLSLLSIGSVVLLFFLTFRNWLRQKQLSEMKSDFINGITHEFNTPLTAILVANRTLQKEKTTDVKPITDVIQRQAERLKSLINHVLKVTTLNRIDLDKRKTNVDDLLDKLVTDYRLQLGDAPVTITLEKRALKADAELDEFWFNTIFLNIFDNAVKYNNSKEKRIGIVTSSDRKNLYIEVRDNGIGIPPAIRQHIFDKFYRNTRSVNGSVEGLGLGLFYVHQAVLAHEWTIAVESDANNGSTFMITLPL